MYDQANPLLSVLLLFGFVILIGVVAHRLARGGGDLFTIVYEWEYALAYRDGRFQRILPPGRYFDLTFGRRNIFRLRRDEQFLFIAPTDVTSADKLVFRVAATATYRIDDPRQAHENPHIQKLQLAASTAVTKAAAARTLDAFLSERAMLDAELLSLVESPISGCTVLSVTVTSVTLPPEVRRLFSEVERARLEGLAALERARGEQASLRSLANAARMLKGNPELMNLRVLQAVSAQGKGQSMLVLGQPAIMPVTSEAGAAEPELPAAN